MIYGMRAVYSGHIAPEYPVRVHTPLAMSLAMVTDTGRLLTAAGFAGAGAGGATATALMTGRTFLRLGIITAAAIRLGSSDDWKDEG